MKLGKIDIEHALFLAPMEEVTSLPFRLMCKRLGADIVLTEFTSAEALIRDIPQALEKVQILDEERPLGIQLFGSKIDSIVKAVEKIVPFAPDFIDLNAGCWARKHVGRGECAALLKDLPHFEQLVKALVNSTSIPVTVKTRLGWDQENINILKVARMCEDAGVKALTVHCRTRNQGYKGTADWDWLRKIREVISIPLIGNGDVVSPGDAKTLFDLGCDGVMIGRGAIAHPWIFRDIKHFIKTGGSIPLITQQQKINFCIEHLQLAVQHLGEKKAVLPFRKFYSGYFKGMRNAAKIRAELMKLNTSQDVIKKLKELKNDKCFCKN